MSTLQAAVLGAVQGLTEFIPISSSGHLVIVPEVLGWAPPGLTFDVLLHAASLLALVVYFRSELVGLGRELISRDGDRRLIWLLLVASVPAALAGLLLADYFERSFEDARSAAVQLVITAVILVGAEMVFARRGEPGRDMDDLTYSDATAVGIAQAISILPGISRSGATIGAGLVLGVGRDAAARFAFLLAIPALFGALLLKVVELLGSSGGGLDAPAVIAGFATSLITSYAAIWGLLRYLRNRTLYPFAVYCVVAGIVFYLLV